MTKTTQVNLHSGLNNGHEQGTSLTFFLVFFLSLFLSLFSFLRRHCGRIAKKHSATLIKRPSEKKPIEVYTKQELFQLVKHFTGKYVRQREKNLNRLH